ncbi:MAG: hypothetical protein Q8O72_02355 [Bacteroidales bacterium]|nr:hypothetical protein [Bacteroidales bacterium]
MTLYLNKYRIESNRMQFWDYSSPGSYFITVNTQDRLQILGKIENARMILSDAGKIVSEFIKEIPTYHTRVILDEWIVMPDHFHCIITLGAYDFDNVHTIHELYVLSQKTDLQEYIKLRRKMLLFKVIGKLKMQTSKHINILFNTPGTKTWQRDYYDHVIRDDGEFQRIKRYIQDNPRNWKGPRGKGRRG